MPPTPGRRGVELALTGLVFVCLLVLSVHRVFGYDVWWQIKAGEWILAHGVPRTDPFSFAFPGREWIEPRWLYCVLVYLLHSAAGPNLLILFKAAMLAATFAILARVGDPRSAWTVPVGLLLALIAADGRLMVRPELVSFALLALTLLALHRFKVDRDARALYVLPFVQVLWANMHTLWILGPAVQWIFLVGELLEGRLRGGRAFPSLRDDLVAGKRLRKLGLVALASTAAAAINPYLLRGLAFPFLLFGEIGGDHYLSGVIAEFHGPFSSLFLHMNYRTLGYIAVIAVSAAVFGLDLRRLSLGRLGLWLAFLFLSVRAQRNVALFGIVAAYTTIANLDEFARRAKGRPAPRFLARVALTLVALYGIVMVPLVATDRFYRSQGSAKQFGFGVSDRRYPIRALAFARKHGLPLPGLNSLGDGGYVLFEGGETSVFIDGRLEVYGAELLEPAIELTHGGGDLERWAATLNLQTVLVRNEASDRGLLRRLESSPEWFPVYFDHLHQIYLRVGPATRELVDRLAIDWSRPPDLAVRRPTALDPPDWLPGWWPRAGDGFAAERLGSFFAAVGNYDRALIELERAVQQDPRNPEACLLLGLFYRAQERENEARSLLERAPAGYERLPEVHFLAGEIEMWARRPREAMRHFERAVAGGGGRALYVRGFARAALAAGEPERASSSLRELIEREPRDFEAWNLLGVYATMQQRDEQALEYFQTSLDIRPQQPRVCRMLARLHAAAGRETEAREMADCAEALESGELGTLPITVP